MRALPSGIVDIVRDFLEAHAFLCEIFEQGRAGRLSFASLRELVGEDDTSLLFRLKERCHDTFRAGREAPLGMRREALFDLAVGSLFHEAMKLRENIYQLEVYAPKVRSLRARGESADDSLFEEFEKITSAVEERLEEALAETEALLAHTVEQLRILLCEDGENGLVTRYLVAHREQSERVFSEGLDVLLAQMHGDAAEGYAVSARSFLDSAFYPEAIVMIETARKYGAPRVPLERLERYALGLLAFEEEAYPISLEHLEAWLDAEPQPDERGLALVAQSALSRIDRLVEAGESDRVIPRARSVSARLEDWLEARES